MAGPVQTLPPGVQDVAAVRAVGRVPANFRARAATDFLGTVADVVLFPGPSVTGQWLVPNQRCLAAGLPSIGTSSTGLTYSPIGTPIGPMVVVQGDPRVTCM